jgi:chromosome segregation ATPase
MGRKADPRGKDRPRTIVLSGDVAEIAEKLAENNQLSATLSELLRHNYGFGDAIEEKKRELQATTDEIELLKERSKHIIANIDALEREALERSTTVLPALQRKLAILEERYDRLGKDLQRTFTPNERAVKLKQHEEVFNLLNAVKMEIRGLEQ